MAKGRAHKFTRVGGEFFLKCEANRMKSPKFKVMVEAEESPSKPEQQGPAPSLSFAASGQFPLHNARVDAV
jgi:hypothetical protein